MTDEALWSRLFAVNLTGTYLATRQAVPDMLAEGLVESSTSRVPPACAAPLTFRRMRARSMQSSA